MKNLTQIFVLLSIIFAGFGTKAQSGIITTFAGNFDTSCGGSGVAATATGLNNPGNVVVDNNGNLLFLDACYYLRKVSSSGILTTVAGNLADTAIDTMCCFGGDGGPATAAGLCQPDGVAVDASGNIFIDDAMNGRIRKINTAGIINTVAGNGMNCCFGTGVAATSVALGYPAGIAVDLSGNFYFCDNSCVIKVNPSGILTIIAGDSTYGFSGDGGPATAAVLSGGGALAFDVNGNLYLTDDNRIRKISTSGIITTVAGNGLIGNGGDGGAATDAELNTPIGVKVDDSGNVYIADWQNNRIRKVNSSGIITTIAGTGTAGFSGDGGVATAAGLAGPADLALDGNGNMYIADWGNNRIRKVLNTPTAISDSFSVYVSNNCGGLQFQLLTKSYNATQHITTWFGNGFVSDTTMSPSSGSGAASLYEPYASAGVYTIKHVLYNGSLPVDSVLYSHTVSLCQTFQLGFFNDALGSCHFSDSADVLIPLPVLVQVDSNGVPVDTVSATGGLYYNAYGVPGDIYSFRIISCPGSIYPVCPSSGVITDTLFEGLNTGKYFGFQCSSTPSFDLSIASGASTARHWQSLNIVASNAYCTYETATLSLTFSPKFHFATSIPAPSSVSGNIATWNLGELSIINSNKIIEVDLFPDTGLFPGDTIMTYCEITPIIGDADALNNVVIRVDTVKNCYDPNYMSVSPSGCIHSDTATTLTYTVLFENTGNDTAHNIYVMDTLSDNLDPRSLRIVSASNTMNVSKWYDSIHHNICKFEFPHINLLDSTHHNQCDGMFIYTIKTKAGLPTSTPIFNHAGIFFDDNPVVMTDTTENLMNCRLSVARSPLSALSPSLFPNPATNQLTILTPGNNYSSFTISNLMGQQIIQQPITTPETKVNITTLPTGIYFVTFVGGGGQMVTKFVKM